MLNKKFSGTYTVLDNHISQQTQLRDAIGKQKFDNTLSILQKLKISRDDIVILQEAYNTLGNDHCAYLFNLLEISVQQN